MLKMKISTDLVNLMYSLYMANTDHSYMKATEAQIAIDVEQLPTDYSKEKLNDQHEVFLHSSTVVFFVNLLYKEMHRSLEFANTSNIHRKNILKILETLTEKLANEYLHQSRNQNAKSSKSFISRFWQKIKRL